MTKSREAFRTISEVSAHLDTPAHVLRFWESKFTQVKPVKRAGGRRYYRPEDIALLGGIKALLHEQGMTIKGVQRLLREKGTRHVAALGPGGLPEDGGGEWIEVGPDDGGTVLAGPEEPAAPLPRVVEIAPQRPPATGAPVPRAGLIAAVQAAAPARLAARRARIVPLLDRLESLRARIVQA